MWKGQEGEGNESKPLLGVDRGKRDGALEGQEELATQEAKTGKAPRQANRSETNQQKRLERAGSGSGSNSTGGASNSHRQDGPLTRPSKAGGGKGYQAILDPIPTRSSSGFLRGGSNNDSSDNNNRAPSSHQARNRLMLTGCHSTSVALKSTRTHGATGAALAYNRDLLQERAPPSPVEAPTGGDGSSDLTTSDRRRTNPSNYDRTMNLCAFWMDRPEMLSAAQRSHCREGAIDAPGSPFVQHPPPAFPPRPVTLLLRQR
ncbi:hypothetical protein CSOJ01_00256 [Colletotrichum sojae]|uniref:Uncharacterized protein n=1 Tax=Colletotrichum sojae TaxID=2175907 RepID=A0A8H6JYT5_9PEZI|nr:hypothetical protein CSOJ01_00256 [Colletotrichum sojae]